MDVHERKLSGFAVFVSSSGFNIVASLAHTEKIFLENWTYMRENRVDSPYLFIASLVTSVALDNPKKKKKCLKGCGHIP